MKKQKRDRKIEKRAIRESSERRGQTGVREEKKKERKKREPQENDTGN